MNWYKDVDVVHYFKWLHLMKSLRKIHKILKIVANGKKKIRESIKKLANSVEVAYFLAIGIRSFCFPEGCTMLVIHVNVVFRKAWESPCTACPGWMQNRHVGCLPLAIARRISRPLRFACPRGTLVPFFAKCELLTIPGWVSWYEGDKIILIRRKGTERPSKEMHLYRSLMRFNEN